ncbi:hypothetical protein LRS11_18175 [Pseudomonas sp. J452]|uniref:hypothetical protein n=1 Tax=Pseudomonas sp. J452 TaxID=2898441 RepID=UPI0021AD53D5|nr:hypothetical protein [Pseudomonas sp. J452]UUY07725.1 hypothetical protein LRS11_18175 [Pseudomonas sp. J452]
MRYLTSKGLFARNVGGERYVLEDVFGVCTTPFLAKDIEELSATISALARVSIICSEECLNPMASPEFANWFELENFYVSKISDHYRYWQVGRNLVETYDGVSAMLPIAYFETGFGSGSKDVLEFIDKHISTAAINSTVPFTPSCIAIRLSHIQIERMCSDLMALLNRSVRSLLDFLIVQRATIAEENWAREHMDVSEIVHSGPKSYQAASLATICVISLCTSLDIMSKLIHFVNASSRPAEKFKSTQGKHFSDLYKTKANTLPQDFFKAIINKWEDLPGASSLIQFRHDLVHSTAALELEKIYVGCQAGEINELPLHYAFVPWRDCNANGQPIRYLGREYFTSGGVDMESQLLCWTKSVISLHLYTGEQLLDFLKEQTKDDIKVELVNRCM